VMITLANGGPWPRTKGLHVVVLQTLLL
jgi:hypothetical protein